MTELLEQVTLWLRRRPLKAYCDDCIGLAVNCADLQVARITHALTATTDFTRKQGACTLCGAYKAVTNSN